MALQRFLFRFVALTYMVLVMTSGACQATGIQRVAILPVMDSAGVRDQAIPSAIETALAAKFHTPLSSFVPVYHVIPGNEMAAAIQAVSTGKSGTPELNKPTLSLLSSKLNADTIIAAKITAYRQDILPALSLEADQKTRTHVAISVYYYERTSDRYVVVRDYREYLGDELPFGDPIYLTRELINDLLAKLPL